MKTRLYFQTELQRLRVHQMFWHSLSKMTEDVYEQVYRIVEDRKNTPVLYRSKQAQNMQLQEYYEKEL